MAFAVALKHRLRFEPYSSYDDLAGLIGHLDTYAKAATTPEVVETTKPGIFKATGQYLGVSFAQSNPRKLIKKAKKPVGNLPLEILTYLAAYVDETIEAGLLRIPMQQTLACKTIFAAHNSLQTDLSV
jgi:putative membrane protein